MSRLLFLQFGDYRTAYYRFLHGEDASYYGQKFTVQWLEEKAKTEEYVGVFCIATDLYEERLPNHVHVIGRDLYQKNGIREVLRCIQRQSPTHIICCFPSRRVLSPDFRTLNEESIDFQGLAKN